MQKSIKKWVRLGMDFWKDFDGFRQGKWRQVGTKMKSNMGFPENTKKAYRS